METLLILVPQGAEYKAVRRGLGQASSVAVAAIPIGIAPVSRWLETHPLTADRVIVMGLCGAIDPQLSAGETVIYSECQGPTGEIWEMAEGFGHLGRSVRGVTSDRVLTTAQEKRMFVSLGDVVDMEGSAIASRFLGKTSMLRVVSDDAGQDLPDLGGAIDGTGTLQPLPMAMAMARQPMRSLGLIRGSLQALNALEKLAQKIGKEP